MIHVVFLSIENLFQKVIFGPGPSKICVKKEQICVKKNNYAKILMLKKQIFFLNIEKFD